MDNPNTDKLDRYDRALSISSGVLTAALDVLWINDFSLADANEWGSKEVDQFVIKIAQSRGYDGNDIGKAIERLEKEFPMDGDLLTNQFGGGSQHHLRDFSHHPTLVGLVFSILMQFTGKGYGTLTNGEFVSYEVPGWKPKGFIESIYLGTIPWCFHLISDVAGSSGTRKKGNAGTGIPGPLLSFLKEISAIPGIRNIFGKTDAKGSSNKEANYKFSATCSKMFNGTLLGEHDENGNPVLHEQLRFDLRTELGIVNESIRNKQYLPVLLNKIIVSSFYSVRRFVQQISSKEISSIDQLRKVDVTKCLPWKSDSLRHMHMYAATTFSAIDILAAGLKASAKNKDNSVGFALDFIQGINFCGIGNMTFTFNSEFLAGLGKMQAGFQVFAEKQKQAIIDQLPEGQKDWELGKYSLETAVSIAKLGTPMSCISASIGVYDEVKKSLSDLKIAKEERLRIEAECSERIAIIQSNRAVMEETVSYYLFQKMSIFTEAISTMDRAISKNDIDLFLAGNNMIQKELTGESMFESMDEFDDMMQSDDDIVF